MLGSKQQCLGATGRSSALAPLIGQKPIRTSHRLGRKQLTCLAFTPFPSIKSIVNPETTQEIPPLPAPPTSIEGLNDYSKIPVSGDMPSNYEDDVPDWAAKRRAGIIIHPTSLPGPYGIGEIGSQARALVDWLNSADMQVWQILPMVPPDPMFYSPYAGTDTNAGNPMVISIDDLIKDGLLDESDKPPTVPVADVDFPAVAAAKTPILKKAAQRLLSDSKFEEMREKMAAWRKAHAWIEDSALFEVARNTPGLSDKAWWDWPEDFRFRKPEALKKFREENLQLCEEWVALQYLFDRQWLAIKTYANNKGIKIVGDMPIYVGGHSMDVWSNQHLFELGPTGAPEQVSGVPPDAFSETGQLWGSPLYKWSAHKKENYEWWCQRMGRALEVYDETRIDHFRAFAGYWAVDAKATTAMDGAWKKGPGNEVFAAMKAKLGKVPILAEDLGVITTDVVQLREQVGAPGMVVTQFAWGGGPGNVHLPHMHYENAFVYPGTHDNETTVGWYKDSANEEDKRMMAEYGIDGSDIAWQMIKFSMFSCARTCVMMMQDVLRLDNTARMNSPGKAAGNWGWRIGDEGVWEKMAKEAKELKHMTERCARTPKRAGAPKAAADVARSATSKDKAPKAEAPKDKAPKAEAPKDKAPKAEAPKAEAPKDKAPKAEAHKDKAAKAEAAKEKAPKDKTSKAEAPKDQAPKAEAPKAEASKEMAAKAEAETVKETVKAETLNVEA